MNQTADSIKSSHGVQEMDTESNTGAVWAVSHSAMESYCWAASTAQDGWTDHTREDRGSLAGWNTSLLPNINAGSRTESVLLPAGQITVDSPFNPILQTRCTPAAPAAPPAAPPELLHATIPRPRHHRQAGGGV